MSDIIKAIHLLGQKFKNVKLRESSTCGRCLAVWAKVSFEKDSADIFRIEEKVEELLLSACKVCQMVGMAMQVYENETSSLESPFLLRWERRSDHSGVAVFHDSNGIKRGERGQIEIARGWYAEASRADSLKSREILEGLHVDFSTIKSWLDECDLHVQCKSGVQGGPRNLKIIDCMERAVVSAPPDCQYVALSYVWGGMVFKTDSTSGRLPTMLPRTIDDSIKATLLLGYSYLWVDAFCIKQDDAEDKHRQIQQMDLIYTSAALTLIAAAGNDPCYGLPGVGKPRKLRYQNASIGDLWISFIPDAVYGAVVDSPWFTRGWTFQEGYVSRRRLYFTESGVLFICNGAKEHGGHRRSLVGSDISILKGTLHSRALEVESDGLDGIMRLLEQYMRRQLSYENDVLNAILGVLNYHHTRNPTIGTICGLPYQASGTGPYIVCVRWTHDRPATRRLGYPSWSPFGWVGPVEFSWTEGQFYLYDQDAAMFSCHIRDGCAEWSHLKTSQYLRITVNVHHLPVVNLVRSDSKSLEGKLSEHPITMLVVPVGDPEVNYGGLNCYMDIKWDVIPPDHYESTRVTCAIFHDGDNGFQWLMILQDHGTHYERIGFASMAERVVAEGFEFDEWASATNGLPTLRPRDSPDFYFDFFRRPIDVDWLVDARKSTIILH